MAGESSSSDSESGSPELAPAKPTPAQTVASLNASLDSLENVLAPLLAKPLWEIQAEHSPLDRAKLNVNVAYVAQDLVWMYLKTRGIDPASHPVSTELARIKGYFQKIKEAEDPERQKHAIDKAAAGRFIRHALAEAAKEEKERALNLQKDSEGVASSSSSKTVVAVTSATSTGPAPVNTSIGVHTRFSMAAKAERQGALSESESDSAEENLEVIDKRDDTQLPDKGKGKEKADRFASAFGIKSKRKPIDPFTGYDGDKPPKKSKKKHASEGPSMISKQMPREDPMDEDMIPEGKSKEGPRKKKKKTKKGKKADGGSAAD